MIAILIKHFLYYWILYTDVMNIYGFKYTQNSIAIIITTITTTTTLTNPGFFRESQKFRDSVQVSGKNSFPVPTRIFEIPRTTNFQILPYHQT